MLGCVLLSCILSVSLLDRSVDCLHIAQGIPQYIDRGVALQPRPTVDKTGEELSAKLLLLDHMVRTENDVMEPKRKRSFPGNNTPLDRLSISSMETKQGTKQRKVLESPRRRANVPIDRIGISRLPNSRG